MLGDKGKGDGSGIGEGRPEDLPPSSESLVIGEVGMAGVGS
jgi:hypothetical protein